MTAKAGTTYLKKLKAEIEVIHHALGKDVVSIDNVSFKQMVVKYLLVALSYHEDHQMCKVVQEVQSRIPEEQTVEQMLKEVVLQVHPINTAGRIGKSCLTMVKGLCIRA